MKLILFFTLYLLIIACNNQQKHVANTSTKHTGNLQAILTQPQILTVQLRQADGQNPDSIITAKFDSLAVIAGWRNIEPADPDASFQKQYTGYIGGEKATVNVNLRAINVRQNKDIIMWAAIGDTLIDAYFNEDDIFGVANNGQFTNELVCKGCRKDSLVLQRKFILGITNKPIAIHFNEDSSTLNGFYYNQQTSTITQFSLHQSTPSLPLNYIVYRYHKHQKWNGNDVAEVPAIEVLALSLPGSNHEAYKKFLNVQAGNFLNIKEASDAYRKDFLNKIKQSHIDYARSMIGGYNASSVVYNQDSFVVIKSEGFEGNAEYYGDMGVDFLSYNVSTGKFLDAEDVMKEDWQSDKNAGTLEEIFGVKFRDFAFVCPLGVAFTISGNHGWEVDTYFARWKLIKPYIQQEFIQQHTAWFK